MLPENPFFVREVRAYSRKAWSPLGWQVLAAAFSPAFWLWAINGNWNPDDGGDTVVLRGVLLAGVVLCHALICGFAGWRLGMGAFGVERRQNTLESLQLVSISAWKWPLQKLVFPLYSLFLVWLAVLPGSVMLVVRGHCLPATLWPGLLLAGAAGLLYFGVALTLPPERVGLPLATERRLPFAQRLELSSPRLIATWLGWELLQLGYQWVLSGSGDQQPDFRQHLLFRIVTVGSDQLFALMLGLLLLYVLTCAWAWANPGNPFTSRLRRASLIVTLVTGYSLVLGITWIGGHWTWRALLVGLPAWQLLRLALAQRRAVRLRHALRPDNPRAVREIAAMQAHWDNPVLIRDLRVFLRGGGLLSSFLRQGLVIGLIFVLTLAYLTSQNGRNTAFYYPLVAGALAYLLGWGAFVAGARTALGTSAQWAAERRMNTVSQLMLSPISGHDIVTGRWSAALLYGGATALPWTGCYLVLALLATKGEGLVQFFCMNAWTFSLALVLSAGRAGAIRELSGLREWWSPTRVSVVWLIAQAFLLVQFASSSGLGSLGYTLGAGILALVNTAAVPALLDFSSRRIERYRARLAEPGRGE